jgi:two-component system, OmpR family, alkaline phosphatase synthesis response regulator PhoP
MNKKILIAEDEPHIAHLVSFKLHRAGYDVIWADDGGKAVEMITQVLPDLIILDVMMPVMDGFEVLTKIKQDRNLHNIPVIMLTSKAQDIDLLKGFDLGTDDYITKPFSPTELLARVKKVLNE